MSYHKGIISAFEKATDTYDEYAEIQNKVADGLIASLIPWKEAVPSGPILEVGCGTGFVTEKLIQQFPDREIIVTDASKRMLDKCKQKLQRTGIEHSKVSFKILNADDYNIEKDSFGLIISGFTPHWFKDTSLALQNLSEGLIPGGFLLCSFPGNHTFPGWYEKCLELGLPHTANPLPDVEEIVVKLSMGPIQIDYYENDLYKEFEHSLEFFRYLKKTGESYSILGKSLSYKQFKLLIDHWDKTEDIKMKWHIVYVAAKREFE
ncbi:methyltransferase domain-containing protein [Gracilimonas sp. Q87]|uniref:methyltransferase domain-containing protein n=1 Tax=Gracilimonas sp. Q87 TaxID=3384766 RepID=UPI003983E40F